MNNASVFTRRPNERIIHLTARILSDFLLLQRISWNAFSKGSLLKTFKGAVRQTVFVEESLGGGFTAFDGQLSNETLAHSAHEHKEENKKEFS